MARPVSYMRTPAGTAAALNPQLGLPRPLRALLVAINGQFDPYTYASRLQGQMDLQSMLDTLQQAGYVHAVPKASGETVGSAAAQVARVDALPKARAASDLRDVVAVITDFVMSHLPDDSLEIILALEGLSSKAQLDANLGAYQDRIAHLGPVAAVHLTELRAMLRSS
jgi:hypothetical protein